jgi:hypothetical protein
LLHGGFELIKISSAIAWNNVEGELAVFDPRDGRYHALNGSAAAIWRGIAEEQPIPTIVARLAERHGAPPERIAADVSAFVATALDKGLLESSGATD